MEPEQGLAMLTRAGAEATGWSGKIGVLSPGYRADLTVIRYPQPHLVGENRLLSNLIYSSAGGDVQAVFVDGSALLWNRSLVHMDEEQIIRRVENRLRRKNFSPESYPSKGKPPAALPGEWEYISRHR
jgi:5-methylthioadenosine/S-adenosylhomocysteine deaminase